MWWLKAIILATQMVETIGPQFKASLGKKVHETTFQPMVGHSSTHLSPQLFREAHTGGSRSRQAWA
jgi:hypothetical protein